MSSLRRLAPNTSKHRSPDDRRQEPTQIGKLHSPKYALINSASIRSRSVQTMDIRSVSQRKNILAHLENGNIKLADLVVDVLMCAPANHPYPSLLADLVNNCHTILNTLHTHSRCNKKTLTWGHTVMSKHYADMIGELAHDDSRWHFNATHAQPAQIQDFRLEDMAETIQCEYPLLWSLMFRLVTGCLDTEPISDEQACRSSGDGDDGEGDISRSSPKGMSRVELDQHKRRIARSRVVVSTVVDNAV